MEEEEEKSRISGKMLTKQTKMLMETIATSKMAKKLTSTNTDTHELMAGSEKTEDATSDMGVLATVTSDTGHAIPIVKPIKRKKSISKKRPSSVEKQLKQQRKKQKAKQQQNRNADQGESNAGYEEDAVEEAISIRQQLRRRMQQEPLPVIKEQDEEVKKGVVDKGLEEAGERVVGNAPGNQDEEVGKSAKREPTKSNDESRERHGEAGVQSAPIPPESASKGIDAEVPRQTQEILLITLHRNFLTRNSKKVAMAKEVEIDVETKEIDVPAQGAMHGRTEAGTDAGIDASRETNGMTNAGRDAKTDAGSLERTDGRTEVVAATSGIGEEAAEGEMKTSVSKTAEVESKTNEGKKENKECRVDQEEAPSKPRENGEETELTHSNSLEDIEIEIAKF